MINFFKKKVNDYPDYWQEYENSFNKKPIEDPSLVRFVVLDTETTGFDYLNDRILCIGALSLVNKNIALNQSLELFLKQDHYNAETAKIHGILKNGGTSCISEGAAMKELLGFLQNAVIVAHHAIFDITMINRALERNGLPRLKNKVLDTSNLYKKTLLNSNVFKKKEHYSLDELAEKFDISQKDRHTAMGDAYITAIAFLKIRSRLKGKGQLQLKDLLKMG
ncbi:MULTISPECIES: PolC-type DNA polymerase III [unclassified Arenibacter]|jgi:DNA polymerase-3 subunit epsilon|uniref:3'-5' exonuclease n=1 Tax=unclassified Arenibacter TaxID=2615047 RepID=UPI000E34F013|nr:MULTISPECIES: 3'-5' exonuclease [unclassified Arenibacter]MCM4165582.1 3'-5' exonuclease [Arenibacter sp. A80]RFT54734.1 3'-5' exonuclease [Arenibacter sp. P308M17]